MHAYSAVIAEKDQTAAELRRKLEEAEARLNAMQNPPKTPEEQSKEFFERPLDLIRSEVAAQIKPLNEHFAQTKRERDYATLKAQMKQDPRFTRLDEIEADFDKLMSGQALDPNIMIAAFFSVVGMRAAAGTWTPTPNTSTAAPTPTPAPTVTTPPHLRPSAPATPVPVADKLERELTENELRLARAAGMTPKEYLEGLKGTTLVVG